MTLTDSRLDPKRASHDVTLESGLGWTHVLSPGQIFRIVDLEGNQAVDTLFYNAEDETERYSAVDTVREQGNLYLSVGTRLLSSEGRALCTIVADTCGRHDTLGGACAAESNQVRYAIEKKYMHNCRDSFLLALARYGHGMTKRDIPDNINGQQLKDRMLNQLTLLGDNTAWPADMHEAYRVAAYRVLSAVSGAEMPVTH